MQYLIGIDFGTTNSTVCYAKLDQETLQIEQFPIKQATSLEEEQALFSLPSFLYYLLDEEKAALNQELSIGAFAQKRGSEVPSRMISSAKSWLCHDGVNRKSAFLPLDSDEGALKISPVKACEHILSLIKMRWNEAFEAAPFNEQQILLTVPASFDPVARELVLEAAAQAGYPEVILLEEPLAAFYAWLYKHPDWREVLKVGDSVLVVDIGGGTTDFSLISVEDQGGNLILNRKAVGSHLLLGGDNIDYALAYLAKGKIEESGHTVDEWQMQNLIHACRRAKETLFGIKPPKQVDVSIVGRGSRLLKSALKATLTLDETSQVIIDGFLPKIAPQERSRSEKKLGLQKLGLPFAQDPRITGQMAKFLSMTGESDTDTLNTFEMPTAVLFNGGTLKAQAFQDRIVEVLNSWADFFQKPAVKVLQGADLDYAVSYGAVYYGFARQGHAVRVKSGMSRSYYIGVEESRPAIPGLPPPLKAICVVPFGMEEGSELELPNQEFALVVGEPAVFRFFSHATKALSNGIEPKEGTVVAQWQKELTELPALEVSLDKQDFDGKTIKVKLHSKVTELGVLELYCKACDEDRQWKLEFALR